MPKRLLDHQNFPNKANYFDVTIPSPFLVDSGTVKALPHQDVEDEEISGGSSVLRDEGYSTMSSDVQGAQETPRRGLEGLAEIQESQGGDTPLGSDSTSVMSTSSSRDRR